MGTGGLGGVHRGVPTPPDVSADLQALRDAEVDLIGPRRQRHVRRIELHRHRRRDLRRKYSIAHYAAGRGGVAGGLGPPGGRRCRSRRGRGRGSPGRGRALAARRCAILIGRPPDESLDVADLIEEVVAEATARGIVGQAVTPYVLSALHERSDGETRRVNRDLIVANAGLAAEIAVAHASL
jgi:pseudouridine-5'-phosphate glycosidase